MVVRKSPFARYANATLKLAIASEGDLAKDPETGNMRPGLEILEFKALLENSHTDDYQTKILPGIDATDTYLEGYLVGQVVSGELQGLDTAFFPEGVKTPIEMEAVVDGKQGKLQILPTVASPYGVDAKTGQKICAYFSYRKGS